MGTAAFRYDYAKFLVECAPENWQSYYHHLNDCSHERKYKVEWLKSHKVNRLWYNADAHKETWAVDIWGEWAGIIEVLDDYWFPFLKRLDVRAIVWEADATSVVRLGHHLEEHITSHNIHTYSSRPATKRMGRDRGGKGFAIGSHKSDLRISCYVRTGEKCALEFQMKGAYLVRLMNEAIDRHAAAGGTISLWSDLAGRVQLAGENRLARILDAAGIGGHWPTLGPIPVPDLPPKQFTFIPTEADNDTPPLPEFTGFER